MALYYRKNYTILLANENNANYGIHPHPLISPFLLTCSVYVRDLESLVCWCWQHGGHHHMGQPTGLQGDSQERPGRSPHGVCVCVCVCVCVYVCVCVSICLSPLYRVYLSIIRQLTQTLHNFQRFTLQTPNFFHKSLETSTSNLLTQHLTSPNVTFKTFGFAIALNFSTLQCPTLQSTQLVNSGRPPLLL